MATPMRNPVSDASAWKGDDLASSHDWIWSLSAADIAELDEALSTAKQSGRTWRETTAAHFPLPTLAARLKEMAETWNSALAYSYCAAYPSIVMTSMTLNVCTSVSEVMSERR